MTPSLPDAFLTIPIAHRALHDVRDGRPENSRAAIEAAIDAGYGIEIDVQLTADRQAAVFHDYALDRLTEELGPISKRSLADLATLRLRGGEDGVPGLIEVLAMVGGKVPLLIELKDQDGALGPDVGVLEMAVGTAVSDYRGPVAVMSFNPHSVAAMQTLLPNVPRGLVTEAFAKQDWPVPEERLAALRTIPDYARVGASFISHNAVDLDAPRVAELKEAGADILCWTVRSPEAEAEARRVAQNVTFEGYLPPLPS